MSSWIDPIETNKSKSDSRELMLHQQEAVESLNNYFDVISKHKKEQNGIVVMPTGERVVIVMGAINVLELRVSGTLTKYISCIA